MIRRVPSATTADAAVENYLQLQRSYLRGSKSTTTTSIDQQLPAYIYGCEDKSELSPDDEDYYSQPPPPIVDVQPTVSTTIPLKSCQPPTSIVSTIRKNAVFYFGKYLLNNFSGKLIEQLANLADHFSVGDRVGGFGAVYRSISVARSQHLSTHMDVTVFVVVHGQCRSSPSGKCDMVIMMLNDN
jgi:hypothetical protein